MTVAAVAASAAELAAAVGLLTRLPVRAAPDRSGAAAFGIVGGVLGVAAAAPLLLLGGAAPLAAGVLAVGLLALGSGALHLDGLADTADALAAPTPAAAEQARADPRVGPAGVVALVVAVVLDAALLAALLDRGGPLVAALGAIVATAVSRSIAAAAPLLAGDRLREGFGRWFAERTSPLAAVCAIGTAVVAGAAIALAVGRPGIAAAALAGILAGCATIPSLARLRGALDGDALGAAVEITFAVVLVVLVVVV